MVYAPLNGTCNLGHLQEETSLDCASASCLFVNKTFHDVFNALSTFFSAFTCEVKVSIPSRIDKQHEQR